MNMRYRVDLSEAEHTQLAALLNGGTQAVRKIKRAQMPLAAEAGVSDEAIASSVSVGVSTVYRTKRRFVEGNLELALSEEARPGAFEAVRQGDGAAGGHRVLHPARRAPALDAGAAGWRDDETPPATPIARVRRCADALTKTI